MLAAALSGCGQQDGNSGNSAAGTPAAGVVLGPLTPQEICDRLSLATISSATGQQISGSTPSTIGTPQCTYRYRTDVAISTVTVAYQRPEGDLAGRQGEAGFDFAVQRNRDMLGGTSVQEQTVQAGNRALRLSSANMHWGVVLVGGRVITVAGFATTLSAEGFDRLMVEVANALGR